MRRNLIFCFALAVFLATGTFSTALAQDDPVQGDGLTGPEQRIERHLDRLDSRLDLTEDQERRIRALLESHAAEMREWRENNDEASREERRAQARQAMAALHGEISGILTSEQSAQMEEMHQRMKQRMGNDRGEHRRHIREHMRDDRGERRHMRGSLMQELDLSDEQKEQLRALREAHRAEMKTWREEHADATREERRALMRERAEQHRAALMHVLTEEQKEQFELLRSEQRQKMQERRDKMQERRESRQERRK